MFFNLRSANGLRGRAVNSYKMQKTPTFHASRIFPAILAGLLTLLVAGCNLTITNLTPDTVPANPSQIYTITASFRLPRTAVCLYLLITSAID